MLSGATTVKTFLPFNIVQLKSKVTQFRDSVSNSIDCATNLALETADIHQRILELKDQCKQVTTQLELPIFPQEQTTVDAFNVPQILNTVFAQLGNVSDLISHFQVENIQTKGDEVLKLISKHFEPALVFLNGIKANSVIDFSRLNIDDLRQGTRQLKASAKHFIADIKNFGDKVQKLIDLVNETKKRFIGSCRRLGLSPNFQQATQKSNVADLKQKLEKFSKDETLLTEVHCSVGDLRKYPDNLSPLLEELEQVRLDFIDPACDALQQLRGIFQGEIFDTPVITCVASNLTEVSVTNDKEPIVQLLEKHFESLKPNKDAFVIQLLNGVTIPEGDTSKMKAALTIIKNLFARKPTAINEVNAITLEDFYNNEKEVKRLLDIQPSYGSRSYNRLKAAILAYYNKYLLAT